MEKTDNLLIAEFMGYTYYPAPSDFFPNGRLYSANLRTYDLLAVKYDTSWDWLLPAYSKFSALEIHESKANDEHTNHCTAIAEKVLSFDIFGAHEKLVEGIKWLNSQKGETTE
jgi:hypothetical protein